MNKPYIQNANNAGAPAIHPAQNQEPDSNAPAFTRIEPKGRIQGPYTPIKDRVNPPSTAAKGDDDLMSQERKPS